MTRLEFNSKKMPHGTENRDATWGRLYRLFAQMIPS